jgi:hypothetical protein
VALHPASSTSLAARPQASRSRSCLPAAAVWYFFKFLLVSVAVVSLCILLPSRNDPRKEQPNADCCCWLA